MLDYDAFRAEQAEARTRGPLPRRRAVDLRRAVDARLRLLRAPRRRRSASSRPGEVNVYIAGGSTGNSIETTVVQLTADALGADIDDVAHDPGRHRGHRLRRRRRREPQRIDDRRRGARDGVDPARAHRRHRRAQARGRARRHRARPTAARACGARRRRASRSPRSPRSPTSTRTRCRPACPPGSRRARGTRRDSRFDLGERHARVHLRGRRRAPAASRSCATS